MQINFLLDYEYILAYHVTHEKEGENGKKGILNFDIIIN